ncbi:MAG TPA: PilZ domain-containing protein [Terriglobia bacterium]
MERRKHRRYIVKGMVWFRADGVARTGELINFGYGGMLVRSNHVLPAGSEVSLRVVAYCYKNSFEVRAKVVGGRISLMAVQFLERPAGVGELLLWLEQENCPWTGTFDGETRAAEPAHTGVATASQVRNTEFENSLERLFQQA